jgi:hypothetical protein
MAIVPIGALASVRVDVTATPSDYRKAIQDAVPGRTVDRRSELQRCVSGWGGYAKERRKLRAMLAKRLNEERLVVLEVGNSAFPRYSYVLAGETREERGRAPESKRRRSSIRGILQSLGESDVDLLVGDASSEIDDADCYFLTVKVGSIVKQIAVYGKPNRRSLGGRLIGALLGNAGDRP